MALYRFLFAPVLLIVAVLAGSGEKAATRRPEHPPAVEPTRAAAVSAQPGPAVTPARGRRDGPRVRAVR